MPINLAASSEMGFTVLALTLHLHPRSHGRRNRDLFERRHCGTTDSMLSVVLKVTTQNR